MERPMKAAIYEEFGGPEKIQVRTVAVPELKEGEVLIKVKAAGVNPADYAVREGYLKDYLTHSFPIIPGWDVAGVVEDRGFSARRFAVGEAVYAYARRPVVQYGTFAEYLVIPESYLAHKPENISWEEAAGIPLVGLTAYQSLFDAGNLQSGQTVLILGASGGVGSLGIQLAKVKGVQVIGVAIQENHQFMKQLDADFAVDYNQRNIGATVKELVPEGVDLIFDCASGDTLQQSLTALKPAGKLASILHHGEGLNPVINFQYVFVEPNSTQLEHLRQLANNGQLKVHVSQKYSLDQAVEALNQIQTHHTTGKIIIIP